MPADVTISRQRWLAIQAEISSQAKRIKELEDSIMPADVNTFRMYQIGALANLPVAQLWTEYDRSIQMERVVDQYRADVVDALKKAGVASEG